MENTEENCEMIWKIWMKCEMIWKIRKKGKLKSEKIWRKSSSIVKRYGKCGRKVNGIVK